jgi:hypothetical protein
VWAIASATALQVTAADYGDQITQITVTVYKIARLAHHVTQRANRLDPVFFETDDYRLCRLSTTAARRARREKSRKLSP